MFHCIKLFILLIYLIDWFLNNYYIGVFFFFFIDTSKFAYFERGSLFFFFLEKPNSKIKSHPPELLLFRTETSSSFSHVDCLHFCKGATTLHNRCAPCCVGVTRNTSNQRQDDRKLDVVLPSWPESSSSSSPLRSRDGTALWSASCAGAAFSKTNKKMTNDLIPMNHDAQERRARAGGKM